MQMGRTVAIPQGFSEHMDESTDIAVHYLRGGAGAPLVLLHGWPQTWYEWRFVMPRLAEHYDVIVPSLRGLCGSSQPADGYDSVTMAGDINGLLRGLGIDEAHVVGHDIGMLVAYAYAATYPDEVKHLVTFCKKAKQL